MTAFDVLLLTSDYEGFGYVLLEAAQAGVPTVSTPVGIAPELLKDGTVGIMAPANATALADACVRLLTDSGLRSRYGQIAQERAASFNVDRMVEKTLSVYRKALGRA